MITLKELSQKYNADISAMYQKIKRNRDKLDGHMQIINGVMQFDDLAAQFLIPRKQMITEMYESKIHDLNVNHDIQINHLKSELKKMKAEKESVEEQYQAALLRITELEQQLFLSENNSNAKGFLSKIFK